MAVTENAKKKNGHFTVSEGVKFKCYVVLWRRLHVLLGLGYYRNKATAFWNAMPCTSWRTFWRNLLPPSSVQNFGNDLRNYMASHCRREGSS
jgi:hypothetical protein